MFDWFFEGRTTVYVVLAIAAIFLVVVWRQTRKRVALAAVLGVVGLAAVYFLCDRLVETDHEQVERRVRAMAAGVKAGDADRIFKQVSDRFQWKGMDKARFHVYAKNALREGWVKDLQVWDFRFPPESEASEMPKVPGNPPLILVLFNFKPLGGWVGNAAYYLCKARFVRDADDQWRMLDFEVYNPFVDTNKPLQFGLPGR